MFLPLLFTLLAPGLPRSGLQPIAVPSRPSSDTTVHIASGGWELAGTLTIPVGRKGRVPAVLLLNRAAGTRNEYDLVASELASLGIASLRVDLRGHGESTNRGRFVPGAANMDSLLQGTGSDIVAAAAFLMHRPEVDPTRFGVVGASYSGEFAVSEAREGKLKASMYAMLSPGSLSDESIRWLDQQPGQWLLLASRQEAAASTREVIAMVADSSTRAEMILVDGPGHATGLLATTPGLPQQLAHWLAEHLGPAPAAGAAPGCGREARSIACSRQGSKRR